MKIKITLLLLLSFQLIISQTKKEINRNGYQIFYSDNLRLDESGRNGSEFYLFTQKENEQDNFADNLNLMIQNLEALNIDLNKFVELTEAQINEKGKIINSKRVKNNGNELHILIYESTINGFELKFMQYDFVKNNKAYFLTYSAKREDFEKYLPEMENVMKSFKI
jgi:hypothetical protein